MKIAISIPRDAALRAGTDVHGWQIVDMPASSLTEEQREALIACNDQSRCPAGSDYCLPASIYVYSDDDVLEDVGVALRSSHDEQIVLPVASEATPAAVVAALDAIIAAPSVAERRRVEAIAAAAAEIMDNDNPRNWVNCCTRSMADGLDYDSFAIPYRNLSSRVDHAAVMAHPGVAEHIDRMRQALEPLLEQTRKTKAAREKRGTDEKAAKAEIAARRKATLTAAVEKYMPDLAKQWAAGLLAERSVFAAVEGNLANDMPCLRELAELPDVPAGGRVSEDDVAALPADSLRNWLANEPAILSAFAAVASALHAEMGEPSIQFARVRGWRKPDPSDETDCELADENGEIKIWDGYQATIRVDVGGLSLSAKWHWMEAGQ